MLKLAVDSLDAVDESVRDFYEEKDGAYHLRVDGLEDTSGLKTALQKERAERAAAEKQAKAWAAVGKSPEEIKEMLDAQAKAEEDKAAKAGEWDKLRVQMNEKHEAALKAEAEKAAAMRTTLDKYLVDAAATSAIAAADGVPELLLPHVQRHVKVVDEDGQYVARVVDGKGDPRVNAKGEPLSISDLVSEMKASEIYGRAFKASGKTGSGTLPGNGAGGAGITKKSDFKSEKDRAAFAEKHGIEAYNALPG